MIFGQNILNNCNKNPAKLQISQKTWNIFINNSL